MQLSSLILTFNEKYFVPKMFLDLLNFLCFVFFFSLSLHSHESKFLGRQWTYAGCLKLEGRVLSACRELPIPALDFFKFRLHVYL